MPADDNDGVILPFKTQDSSKRKFMNPHPTFLRQAVKTSFTRPESTKHVKKLGMMNTGVLRLAPGLHHV